MSTEEFIRLIVSFFGGGVVAGIIAWLRQISSEKEARKINDLNNRLINLYGPLYFFTSQNDTLFKLNEKHGNAYKIEYEDANWSTDKETLDSIDEECRKEINIINSYTSLVVENNDKILELLKSNYQFIDINDIQIFQDFITDYTRFKKELGDDKKLITPQRIYKRIGSISFMKPSFINTVADRFNKLNSELKKYQAK